MTAVEEKKAEGKLVQRWVTLDFGTAVKCEVQIWCREGSTPESNQKDAVNILNTKVELMLDVVNKPQAKNVSWNITNQLGR